jgi:hypothetical protein
VAGSGVERKVIHIRDNIYIEIYYELESVTVWNVIQDRWVIYVNKNDSIEKVLEKGLEFINKRGG